VCVCVFGKNRETLDIRRSLKGNEAFRDGVACLPQNWPQKTFCAHRNETLCELEKCGKLDVPVALLK